MNEELKKAYKLVERDLRNRTAEGCHACITIYTDTLNGVRVEVNGEAWWSGSLLSAIEDLSKSE